MSEILTYRADSMQAALDLVRRELGGGAVILHTRIVSQSTLVPWRRKQQVEITAARPRPAPPVLPATAAKAAAPGPVPSVRSSPPPQLRPEAHRSPSKRPASAASDFGNAHAAMNDSAGSPAANRRVVSAEPRAAGSSGGDLDGRLHAIQQMLEHLRTKSPPAGSAHVPGGLFGLYTELIDADLTPELAGELIQRLHRELAALPRCDDGAARSLLSGLLEAELRCGEPIRLVNGRCRIVALVGPTGVGKTTTIAKLAGNFRLRDGVKLGLLTVDTYRVAAVDQLRTYAEIMGVPLKVVTSPPEMRRALDELAGLELVLIDTGGRSPHDALKMQELRRLLAEAHPHEVHLVLSMSAGLASQLTTAQRFNAVSPTNLLLTKLDEAAGLGAIPALCRQTALPISYVTTGQEVPHDIEPAQPARLARRILGREAARS